MKLLHYARGGELSGEYIVLVDSEEELSDREIRSHCRPGFHLHTKADVEGERLHQLPTETSLEAK